MPRFSAGEQFQIAPLSGDYDRTAFSCGSEALDRYFREQASQDIKRRVATCFVATRVGTLDVAGYYTLAATSIALALLRTARTDLGVFAMLVDAKNEKARRFYERFGFSQLKDFERRLVLPIATALKLIEKKSTSRK